MNRETPRNKDIEAQEHDQGIRERSGWCSSRRVLGSSLRVRGGGWVTMNSLAVEISIAGGVRKMVRETQLLGGKAPFYSGSFPQP